ncbi:MAG: TetR/AcrR family transcriptional regulator [Bacteroidota bacterium]
MKVKSAEKEAEIERVVLDITWEVGLAGLKMSNIAKRANLAHGTVYIYFKNKQDLINGLFKKVKRKAAYSIGTGSEIDGNFYEALQTIWRKFIVYLVENQREIHFLRQCMESPFLEENNLKLSDVYKQNFLDFLEKGKASKNVKSMNTELLSSIFSGLAREIVDRIEEETLELNDDLIADSFELCWHAIRK